jgi:hypothetical protein
MKYLFMIMFLFSFPAFAGNENIDKADSTTLLYQYGDHRQIVVREYTTIANPDKVCIIVSQWIVNDKTVAIDCIDKKRSK